MPRLCFGAAARQQAMAEILRALERSDIGQVARLLANGATGTDLPGRNLRVRLKIFINL